MSGKRPPYIPKAERTYIPRTKSEQEAKPALTITHTPRAKYTKEERDNEADFETLQKVNKTVTKPIMRISRFGRNKRYTPTKMRNKINDYFCHCEKRDMVPSIKGMMLYLKMCPEQIYTYAKYPEFTELVQQARMIIADWLESDVYAKGSVGKIAYMQNLHNWSNKQEVETSERQISVEEAQAKIASLAPALLEMLKNPEILKQLLPQLEASKTIEADVESANE